LQPGFREVLLTITTRRQALTYASGSVYREKFDVFATFTYLSPTMRFVGALLLKNGLKNRSGVLRVELEFQTAS
jgi:hypothetical protein